MHLLQHTRRAHKPPVITGTLTYKKAQQVLQMLAQSRLARLRVGEVNCDNVWWYLWLGSLICGNGDQEAMVQRQCDVMWRQFNKLQHVLTNRDALLRWRLQYYVTGVLATALHNIGC